MLEWNAPWAKWFVGGKLNVAYNCVDRHANSARRNKAAIIWEGEPGDSRVLTYGMLEREVNRFANALRSLGVGKGDRVAIYMGMVPELAIAMLACAKIGAPHSIVFGGFSAEALRERINDAKAKVVVTCDGAWRRGSVVALKASRGRGAARHAHASRMSSWCGALGEAAKAPMQPGPRPLVARIGGRVLGQMRSRTHGRRGHALPALHQRHNGQTQRYRAHHGRVSGGRRPRRIATSSISRRPTSTGARRTSAGSRATPMSFMGRSPTAPPTLMYEGTPDYPDRDRFWSIIDKYGVNIFYTAPTAIRTFMRWGTELPARHSLARLCG